VQRFFCSAGNSVVRGIEHSLRSPDAWSAAATVHPTRALRSCTQRLRRSGCHLKDAPAYLAAFPAWRPRRYIQEAPRAARMSLWPYIRVSGPTQYRPAAIPGTNSDGKRQGARISVWDRQWPMNPGPCEATTARMPSRFLCFRRLRDYQSNLRNCPPSPPNSPHCLASPRSALERATRFRPGLPGAGSDSYGDAFNQINPRM